MLDFTSSLYLGFRHPFHSLGPWQDFTAGAPAALSEPAANREVAHSLAQLQGCEKGVIAPSTLHLLWDLFGVLVSEPLDIYMDAGIYPIARWGVERAAGRGSPVQVFPHYDPIALRRILRWRGRCRPKPLIVADGFCPACGKPAPVGELLACARNFEGLLIIDDTQSLGIIGHSPGPENPYGHEGGGVLRWSGVSGPEIIMASSLAKGFGVPMAVLSGSNEMIGLFKDKGETRVHCSQPSASIVSAAIHALEMNSRIGDTLRNRLAALVDQFRKGLASSGISTTGGIFPFQTIAARNGIDAVSMHEHLLRRGVKTVLHKGGDGKTPRISFIITVRHTPLEIDHTARFINEIVNNNKRRQRDGRGIWKTHPYLKRDLLRPDTSSGTKRES